MDPRRHFDNLSPKDWLAKAERYERMAEHMRGKPDLSAQFRELAADARQRAAAG